MFSSVDGFRCQLCHQQRIALGCNKFPSLLVHRGIGDWFVLAFCSQIYSIAEIGLTKLDLVEDLDFGSMVLSRSAVIRLNTYSHLHRETIDEYLIRYLRSYRDKSRPLGPRVSFGYSRPTGPESRRHNAKHAIPSPRGSCCQTPLSRYERTVLHAALGIHCVRRLTEELEKSFCSSHLLTASPRSQSSRLYWVRSRSNVS